MEGPQNQQQTPTQVSDASNQPNQPNQQQPQAVRQPGPGMPRPYYQQRPPYPQGGYMPMQGYGMMQPMMINPQQQQQQQEQFRAMQQKFAVKSTLKDECSKHQGQTVIFESPDGKKYCEKCYFEIEQENKEHSEDNINESTAEVRELLAAMSSGGQKSGKQENKNFNSQQRVGELQSQLQNLLNNLSVKMQKKVEHLNMRYQQLSLYESTLNEKYNPVFNEMKETIQEKQLDYMTYLLKQLNQNKDRVALEKITLNNLMSSFYEVSDDTTRNMESQLKNIETQDKENEKIVQDEQTQSTENVGAQQDKENEGDSEKQGINTYQIEALSTMIDDFDNIITKNYCVYTNYEDFSFAQSRSKQQLEEQFKEFVKSNFSGDYQLQNWFNQEILPRIYFLQQNTKFIYTYKILHSNSECQLIQNTFTFPEKGRYIATPEGHLYFTGGYFQLLKLFSNNNFILDEHRSVLVALNKMNKERADHAILYYKGNIYVFGGMSQKADGSLESLKHCESYSITEDKWTEFPQMMKERQGFSVCTFNDKYFFVIGGKTLKEYTATWANQAYNFVDEIEVFEIERAQWRSINYVSDKNKLQILYPGTYQITGKKIMIFGGATVLKDEGDENQMIDCGQKVSLSNETLYFNVTNGEIKRGPELTKHAYFISGGYTFPQQGKIHAFGFGLNKELMGGISGLSAENKETHQIPEMNSNTNKKILYNYKVSDHEWTEIHESIFTGQRRRSLETLDEAM